MFQRFKNALDQLEEQARKPTPSVPPRNPQQRRVQSSNTQRAPRVSSDQPKVPPSDLAAPDPDPASFEPDLDANEDPPVKGHATTTSQSDQQTTGKDDEADDGDKEASGPAADDGENEPTKSQTKDSAPALPDDVQAKLRKLTRLETKYQDLLKAYRKAHARNSVIEPFENKLKEVTPLTSISDPDAFVELINQMTQRTGMVIDELKRVSTDRDNLKTQLEEARQDNKKAYDEVVRLEQESENRGLSERDTSVNGDIPAAAAEESGADAGPVIRDARLQQSSSTLKPTAASDSPDDIFSVDDEVPRLEADIASKVEHITALQGQNEELRNDLASARESAQQMIQNLELTQGRLDSLKHEHARAMRQLEEAKGASELEVSKAQSALQNVESELSQLSTQHSGTVDAKDKQISALEKELETMRSDLASKVGQISHLQTENHDPNKATGVNGADSTTVNQTSSKQELQMSTANDGTTQVNALSGKKAKKKLDACLKELDDKRNTIEKLQAKIKEQEDLVAEIETLRGDLSDIGSEHVDAKHELKIIKEQKAELEKQLQAFGQDRSSDEASGRTIEEFDSLKEKISALEQQLSDEGTNKDNGASAMATEVARAREEMSQLREQLKSHVKDLEAAQSLASTRFREVQTLKDRLQKIQPELGALRTEVKELRNAKKDLGNAIAESKKMEARSQNLRAEIESYKKRLSDKDGEIRILSDRVGQESSRRMDVEESSRKSQRELERLSIERAEAMSARDTLQDKFSAADKDLRSFREKAQRFESDLNNLRREAGGLREEMELKSAQQASAQSLMNSVRDQASEMAVQMKETQQRYDSLEEELADAHRLMSERSREGETMRRLIHDVETRAESRVKEMKERMEIAIQERDRAEDEASNLGRRRAREVEELRKKAREAERELKAVVEAKSELADVETELRRLHEEDLRRVAQTMQEMQEMKRSMGDLRDTLDEGERQARELEEERNAGKEALEEALGRIEKLQKTNKSVSDELRSLRANRIKPTDSPSSRSSFDGDSRLQSPAPASRSAPRAISSASGPAVANGSIDYVYLKNILLQFLEQRDKKNQMQLVPVLGKILHFDKTDELRWSKAVNTR